MYTKSIADEVAVIPNFGEINEPTNREAIIFDKSGNLKIINANNSNYDPIAYPLMFPTGQAG